MNKKILLSIIILFVILLSTSVIANDQEEILGVLGDYYYFFLQEDLDSYYNTISTEAYSEKKLSEKKEITEIIWERFDTISYSIKDAIGSVDGEISYIDYIFSAKIQDINQDMVEYERAMTAILFKENGNWKIFATMPTASFDIRMSLYGQELDINSDEEFYPEYEDKNLIQKIGSFFSDDSDKLSGKREAKCGNKVCEDGEYSDTCPSDCPDISFCNYDIFELNKLEDTNLSEENIPGMLKGMINNNVIRIHVIDEDINWYLTIKEGKINFIEPTIIVEEFCFTNICRDIEFYTYGDENPEPREEEITHTMSMSSCTLADLVNEDLDFLEAYQTGFVKVKGETFGKKTQKFFVDVIFGVYKWFNPPEEPPSPPPPPPYIPKINETNTTIVPNITIINPIAPPANIEVEENKTNPTVGDVKPDAKDFVLLIEDCQLISGGKYSWVEETSRSPDGEIYLGDGGAQAVCQFSSEIEGLSDLYLSINDDAIHASGTRDADFDINGEKLHYTHISKNTINDEDLWEYVLLGQANLKKGSNVIKITKTRTTNAAFLMNKMKFTTV